MIFYGKNVTILPLRMMSDLRGLNLKEWCIVAYIQNVFTCKTVHFSLILSFSCQHFCIECQ